MRYMIEYGLFILFFRLTCHNLLTQTIEGPYLIFVFWGFFFGHFFFNFFFLGVVVVVVLLFEFIIVNKLFSICCKLLLNIFH